MSAYEHEVKRNVMNHLTGKEVKRSATVVLPFPKDLEIAVKEISPERLLEILKDKAEDVVFWSLYGLKIAAFNQVRNSLQGFDSDDEEMSELNAAFENSVASLMKAAPDDEEMRRSAVQFVLSQKAYAELKPALETFFTDLAKGGNETYDFNVLEIKKPGKRGRQKKEDSAASVSAQRAKR